MGTSLPPREANQFKLIVKAYETKQYKKGVKAADAILKKFPEHGETLAMKGLILNCMDKKTEAYDLVRRGLKLDLKSHVCWHVYGLLYRSDRKYWDAIKCYLNALRIDPQNQQILKDLSLLQVQMRDIPGFVESRRQLLVLRPNQRNNWLAFAVAQHLNGSYDMALRTLEAYEGTVDEEPAPTERYEQSELVLYKVRVMEEAGRLEDALTELAKQDSKIVDRLGLREQRATLLLRLERPAEARREYEELLKINPDNYRYFEGLQACLALKPSAETVQYTEWQVVELKKLFSKLEKLYPKSAALKRIPLDFLQGDEFAEAVKAYICRFIRKGVPSLFSDLEPLYQLPGKADILDSVLSDIEALLRQTNSLPGDSSSSSTQSTTNTTTSSSSSSSSTVTDSGAPEASATQNGQHSLPNGIDGSTAAEEESDAESDAKGSIPNGDVPPVLSSGGRHEAPTSLLWLLFLKAQHHNKRGSVEQALQAINEAIQHTPTVQDLFLVKARILQGAGDYKAAARLADSARSMDLSDRYLNSEAVQMMLRADEADLAEKTAALFTKHGEQHENLFDMQCMWYELGSGDSYLRQKVYGRALKNYMAVHKHYNDMVEDQFDFHTYCLRKMTLRAYVDTLKWEDHLHSFQSFCDGAKGLIRCYLELIDLPSKKSGSPGDEEEENQNLSAAEKRKLRQKQRKAENKAKKEAEDKKKEEEIAAASASASASKKGNAAGGRTVDPDPEGLKLLEEEDKLGKAKEQLTLLQEHSPKDFQTHELAFELATRRNKTLLQLQAVKRLHKLSPQHPTTHRCLIRFFLSVQGLAPAEGDGAQLVRQVLELERTELGVPDSRAGLQETNSKFFQQHGESLPHRAAAAVMEVLLDPSSKQSALTKILEASEPKAPKGEALAEGCGLWGLEECVEVHGLLLRGSLADPAAAESWRLRCAEMFPYSVHFQGAQSSAVIGLPLESSLTNGVLHEGE